MKLVGGTAAKTCPTCGGAGRVQQPPTLGRTGVNSTKIQPGTGSPIPCPACKGKKVIPT